MHASNPQQGSAFLTHYYWAIYRVPWRTLADSYGQLDSRVHELNWIQFTMNPDESTGSAGRVEFELSWALWKAVMMNLTWALTQSTWIPSESESIIFKKESKNRLNVTITIHFLSQGRAYGNSQLDIMKEAVAGLFCISLSIASHSEMYGILAVSPAKLQNLLPK